MFVNTSFYFFSKTQYRNSLEIESLIQAELSLALSGLEQDLEWVLANPVVDAGQGSTDGSTRAKATI